MKSAPRALFRLCAVASAMALFVAGSASAAEVHPIEAELRRNFPGVAIESAATFEPGDALVRGTLTSGLRPRFARTAKSEIAVRGAMPGAPMPEQSMASGEPVLQVLYPRSYDGLLVVELGDQRVVLRATGAFASQAVEVNGKLVYSGAYPWTDAVEVPLGGRSEELLLLRDERAPRMFDYEIVETEGVAAVVLDDGAIRFLPEVAPPAMSEMAAGRFTRREPSLQIDRPWLIDADGKRSEHHASWTLIGGGAIPKGIRLKLTTERLAFPIVVDPSFSVTGSLGTARYLHTATLLPNGKVLIAGGHSGVAFQASAELYEPTSGTFSPTGSLGTARSVHTATLLPNGKVLIAGGYNGAYLTSAELDDPASGTFSATGSLGTARYEHTATLLPNGKVLIAGGQGDGFVRLASAELYDAGDGFADARRPVITSAPASLALPATLTIIGSGFRGDSEASSGGTNSSATNYPIVQLQRIDNEQMIFVTPNAAFTDVSWSAALNALAPGWYRATLFTNAIPSVQHLMVLTLVTPTITDISPNRGVASGGQTVTITGTNLSGVVVTIGGNTATVTGTTATSATFITPPHAPGAVDVTVTTPSGVSTTATGGYTYVANPPTNVVATAESTTSVQVSWTAAPGATEYQVLRSTDGVNYTPLAGISGTTYTDLSASADTAYLYAVRASAPNVSDNSAPDLATTVIFTDPTLAAGTTVVKAVHFTELRTAVNAVRQLAGLGAPSYTDATITAGATMVKAAHVTELRTALNEARSALSLPPLSYSHPTLTAGVSVISAADISELRNGTQ
ncbi:MAG TPA: IPT/TIG domain-containing protein [Gemmatimonadaceae bacterium]|nr:IPT/TIG domain-containing protein [Gemmatimonadaceae bacterium]